MPFRTLPVVIALLALAAATPAHADSTVTQTVPPDGTLRSSPDAAPSPATPMIVTVTAGGAYGSCPGCQGTPSEITIALKDKHDRAIGPGLEGPSGYAFVGPQFDIASSGSKDLKNITVDVDASVVTPGLIGQRGFAIGVLPTEPMGGMPGGYQPPTPVGHPGSSAGVQPLPGGDFRVNLGAMAWEGSYDLYEEAWFASPWASGDLNEVLTKGVHAFVKTNYRAAWDWKVKVSSSVARTLKLKSTTIGKKSSAMSGPSNERFVSTYIPLVADARKALKKYKKVKITLEVVGKSAGGDTIEEKASKVLKLPESELE